MSKIKNVLKIALIVLIIGHIGMYIAQRSEWLYKDQLYRKAKEWLIGANFMMVYGNFLTKLPFIDEKSFIIQPVLALQDYFIKRWKENLPNDDAEKYTDWYVFRLMMYIASDRIYLFIKYDMDEVKKINEKAWETIENMVKYEAKDKMFQEIRYAAFNNSSVIFAKNVLVNWSNIENKNGRKLVNIKTEMKLQDVKQHERLIKLREYIKYMNTLYSSKYPEIYDKAKKAEAAEYYENARLHSIVSQILHWQILTNEYANIDSFCQTNKNEYLKDYTQTRDWLVKNKEDLEKHDINIHTTVIRSVDDKIKEVCENLNL
ncbi:hypothetical protein [Campylobacter sp. CCUG 57310]|uniref:hypothetical protein n=1 Tax=Campylobacter sp. CCUG 57310 TaxID=2517362 RepID=UPI0015645FA4|nr:hypothetical protein [Campylobacter sp. CCUG 57310]QKF92458.1 hypothetical protein CORI_1270 [Campylobacter sp. CCUG 57310]